MLYTLGKNSKSLLYKALGQKVENYTISAMFNSILRFIRCFMAL